MSKRDNGRELLIKLLEHRELDEVLGSLKKEVKKDDKPKKWFSDPWKVWALLILSYPIVGPFYQALGTLSAKAMLLVITGK